MTMRVWRALALCRVRDENFNLKKRPLTDTFLNRRPKTENTDDMQSVSDRLDERRMWRTGGFTSRVPGRLNSAVAKAFYSTFEVPFTM